MGQGKLAYDFGVIAFACAFYVVGDVANGDKGLVELLLGDKRPRPLTAFYTNRT